MDCKWSIGMRFMPTDEELIRDYLWVRLNNGRICEGIIQELNIYNYEPSELQNVGINHDGRMYFFTPIFRKHGEGSKINRLTKQGYWKASQSTRPILGKDGQQIGAKRPLVYYCNEGEGKSGKTEWLMNEYMVGKHSLVLCEIHHKEFKRNNKTRVVEENLPDPYPDITLQEIIALWENEDQAQETHSMCPNPDLPNETQLSTEEMMKLLFDD